MTQILSHTTVLEQDKHQLHPLFHPSRHNDPLVVESADRVWINTTDGRRVLDGMAGLWNVNVGYGNRELPAAAFEQMTKLAYTSNFVGMTNVPSAELAARLSGFAHPTLKTTFFTSGGSESNDSAFKTARYYWWRLGRRDKVKVIARKYAYHGITVAATAATGIARYQTMFGPMAPGFSHIPAPHPYRYEGDIRPGESVGQAASRALEEAILREGPETVAAFIAEPIQGVGGVIIPPDDYFPLVREICDKYDVLLIADEVITGFGRTGNWFAIERAGVVPDIMTFAKAMTAGYAPMGGLVTTPAIVDALTAFRHVHTFSGHAGAAAAANTVMTIKERDGLIEQSRVNGAYFLDGLQEVLEPLSIVGQVRGVGMWLAVDFTSDKQTRAPFEDDTVAAVVRRMHDYGVIASPIGTSFEMAPPLITSRADLDEVVKIAEKSIREIAQERGY